LLVLLVCSLWFPGYREEKRREAVPEKAGCVVP